MSGFQGQLISITLSMSQHKDEWHQRTGIVKRAKGMYDLYPAFPDNSKAIPIQFVARPYKSDNARNGVTPEALLATVAHHLEQGPTNLTTLRAIEHINKALHILHDENPITDKD